MQAIWITGGRGFIGRHLARHVAGQGFRVFGIGHGLWPRERAADWSYSHWSNGEVEPANLSQLLTVSGAPDTIFHLAGGSSVGASFENPHEDFSRTVETAARLLEWVRLNSPASKVVAVSSAAVYGSGHSGPIPSGTPLAPYSPYGAHKTMMEGLFRSYSENFGLQTVVVRLFSVYGAGLEKQLIWDICCKLAEHAVVRLGGTGLEVRDWLHVTDAARLLWVARTQCSRGCEALNGGTGIGTSVSEVAALVRNAWGGSAAIEFSGQARKGDPACLIAAVREDSALEFEPRVSLEEGIQEAVDWFKRNRHK